jgi:SAM-dependent methyltransferase
MRHVPVSHLYVVTALLFVLCGSGCSKKASDEGALAPASPPAIECPLQKAGVDPQHLKPFEDVEKYIAFLERPDRAAWQKPDEVVRALQLSGNEVIADVGAGSGYFTFRFAAALPRGRVVAIDIEPEMIRHIHHKAMTEGITNVQPVLASADDPKVPAAADIVFLCDVLHHVQNREAWLGRLHDQMKPGARLVLVEFKEGELPEGPPAALKISRDDMLALLRDLGFTFVSEDNGLLPYQGFLVFRK